MVPEKWWEGARFAPCAPTRDLPPTFDWRDYRGHNYVPPIRDQGYCGSCWAFGTVGLLESNIMIRDGVSVDLSEQWLVSCNQDWWGCGGGFWGHDYHQWKTDFCGGTGAVLESAFPYVARDVPCNCPYPHPYLLTDWVYIGTDKSVPPVNAIKQAILDYGPVSAAVYVNDAFQAYSGGVFNACAGGPPNHAVVLVGWNDAEGGYWILRNSWGTWGGEGGYMRIAYNCSNIGYSACYAIYTPLEAPDLVIQSSSLSPAVEVSPGDPIVLTDVVENQGTETATRFWVSWYVSTDSEVTTRDLLWSLGWRPVDYVAPGETSTESYSVD